MVNRDIEAKILEIMAEKRDEVCIRVAAILKQLPLDCPFNPRVDFPRPAMIKSLILMKLKGIKFQAHLSKYLRENEDEALDLGFYKDKKGKALVPDQRSISYFINHKLTPDERGLIDTIVHAIERISTKFGILLDVENIKPEVKKEGTDRTQRNRKEKKVREMCKFVRKNVYPQIGLELHHNAIYAKKDFLDLLTHITVTNSFAEGGAEILNLEKKSPVADTLFHHIKKSDSIEEVQKTFMKVFEYTYRIAKKHGILNERKAVDVAVDFTEWPYYGDENDYMVVSKKFEKGTCHCYKFVTISVVESGRRIVLMALPVEKFQDETELVEKLLEYAQKKIRIKKLYIDRGFFKVRMLNLFKKRGIKFVMPAVRNAEIKKLMKGMDNHSVIKNYQMGKKDHKTVFNLFILERDDKKYVFATNLDINENETAFLDKLGHLYSKRWGIETSYRVLNKFRPKTTAKNYVIRLFYYMYSMLFYNLWIIMDSIISLHLFGKLIDKHLVPARIFGTLLFTMMDPP